MKSSTQPIFGKHAPRSRSRSASLALAENGFRAIFQLASAILLSRLLAPQDFGVFAVMMVLHGLLAPLLGNAFSNALIQKFDLGEVEASNFFWVATAASASAGFILALSGPILAQIFADEVFVRLAPVFAFLLWLDTIGAQYQALAKRSLRFGLLLRVQMVALPLSLLAGILAALSNFGVWALVVQVLVASLAGRLLIAVFLGWRPRSYDRSVSVRDMLRFGARMGLGAMTGLIYDKLPLLFLAGLGGTASAGQFNRSDAIFKRPLDQSVYPLSSLFLPTMAAAAKNPARLQLLVAESIWFLVLVSVPLMIATLAFGDWLVLLLLGNQWAEAGQTVRWLAVLAIAPVVIRPISALNAALGRPARGVGLKLAALPFFFAAIIWAAPQGAVTIAATMAIFSVGLLPLQIFVQLKGHTLSIRSILMPICLGVTIALLAGGTAYGVRSIWPALIDPTSWTLAETTLLFGLYLACYLVVGLMALCVPQSRTIIFKVARKLLGLLVTGLNTWSAKAASGKKKFPSE